jgi:hypothetical protein
MTNNQFEREMAYGIMLHLTDGLRKSDAIEDGDYTDITKRLLDTYTPLVGGLMANRRFNITDLKKNYTSSRKHYQRTAQNTKKTLGSHAKERYDSEVIEEEKNNDNIEKYRPR